MKDWWKGFFREGVYPLASLIDIDATRLEVRELRRLLPAGRGARVLDVACGVGRHSVPLAAAGYDVTGLDYSASYLKQARRRAQRAKLAVRFVQGDMRRLPFAGRFDVVLNLWTSFGYFPSRADDERTLRSMRRALKPGGWLVLEVVDPARFTGGFPPRHWDRIRGYWMLEATSLREGKDPAMIAERFIIAPNGRTSRARTFVRMYSRPRLKAALEKAGFERVALGRGLIEQGAGAKPSRILALARRPF